MKVQRLDPSAKQNVRYCIDLWLRDQQINSAIRRSLPQVVPTQSTDDEPFAVACFGPSLADTWEELKPFGRRIMTCSGSHRFLIDHGIVPQFHVEVDPREHKVDLIGEPHPDVRYLIASTCHPKVFDHLSKNDVRLWHVFDNADDAIRTLPQGEWALTGGCSVGLRCLTLARFLGYRNLHVFGMDGCEGKTGKHAAPHPNQAKGHAITVVDGVEYKTTPGFLEAARQTFHELDQMPDVTAKFYGDGLVQALAKTYVRKPASQKSLAYGKGILITDAYRKMNSELHNSRLDFGVGGGRYAEVVTKLAATLGERPSVLDYGCGKGLLGKALTFPIWEYDPAILEKSEPPRAADLVVCTDVLEHIEPDCLDAVLMDLSRCVKRIGYFVIHIGPSMKTLPDGRNAHLIQEGKDWWTERIARVFAVAKVIDKAPLIHFVVAPKKAAKAKGVA